jgi:hypothetical protein
MRLKCDRNGDWKRKKLYFLLTQKILELICDAHPMPAHHSNNHTIRYSMSVLLTHAGMNECKKVEE